MSKLVLVLATIGASPLTLAILAMAKNLSLSLGVLRIPSMVSPVLRFRNLMIPGET